MKNEVKTHFEAAVRAKRNSAALIAAGIVEHQGSCLIMHLVAVQALGRDSIMNVLPDVFAEGA